MKNVLVKSRISRYHLYKQFTQQTQAGKEIDRRYRNLVEFSPDMISVHQNGLIVYINQAGLKLLGATDLKELVGRSVLDFIHPDYHEGARLRLQSTQQPSHLPVVLLEVALVTVDGQRIETEILAQIIDYQGQPAWQVIARDITERKQAEEVLKHSEATLRTIMDTNPQAVVLVDKKYQIQVFNKIFSEQTKKLSNLEISRGDDYFTTLPPLLLNACKLHLDWSFKGKTIFVEEQINDLEGASYWFEVYYYPIIQESEEVEAVCIRWVDITRRKQSDKALQDSQVRLSKIFHSAPIPIILSRMEDGRCLDVNSSFTKLTGYSLQEAIGRTKIELLSLSVTERENLMKQLRQQNYVRNYEIQIHNRYGEPRWVVASIELVEVGGEKCTLSTFYDITERKQLEEAVHYSEQFYRTLVHNLPDAAVMLYDSELRYTLAEGAALEASGFDREKMEGKTIWEILPPDSAQALEPYYRAALVGKTSVFERQNGGRVYYTRILPVRNEQDKIFAGMIMVQDITELKRAEAVVAAEKERLTVTLRSIGDGVITTDTAGRITLLNKVAEELTGWSQSEAAGKSIEEVFYILDEKTRQSNENPVYKTLQTGQILELANHTILINRNGGERGIADSCAPIRDRNSDIIGAVLVFRDVTGQQKINEELLKTSKLEALGILAGGIAHDFNNLLTSITGGVSLAKSYDGLTEEVLDLLDMAEKAALRSKDLTQQLLTFAKGGAPIRKTTQLSQVIRDSARFALHGANVQCEFVLTQEIWPVEIDIGQISQVIQNLVLNAVQAMPQGGKIVIKKENLQLAENTIVPLAAGRYLKLSIKDEGVGIEPENLAKIFDPYFTTKSQGTGLGLAVCYSIVKKHDGYLAVESEIGKGTTFSLYLPALDQVAQSALIVKPDLILGQGRILVMDDEVMLQQIASRVLTKLGYEVQVAKDGEEALELYQQAQTAGQPFSAVLLDLTIPGGMGGQQTMVKLLEINPQVKAIVCSGYSNDPIMANYRDYGFAGVLLKPYMLNQLSNVFHRVISG